MTDRVGQQLGNYRLIRLLGQGGFAEVYLAEHIHLRSLGAVKLLYGKITPQGVQAFINEARTIASLAHSHILRVLEFGFEQTLPFLVMEYAPGGTLRDHYPSGSLVPLPTVLSFVKQVASALAYAHNKKLIHRDVKPENMLIDAANHILLSDFGVVAVAHSTASMKTIDSAGTVHYMAPEHINGKPLPASDQYALGVAVYEWLCGERPFQGDTAIEIAMRQLHDNPPSLCQRVPSLSPEVEQVVLKALAKDPKLRFPDIATFSSALEQASQTQQKSRRTKTQIPTRQVPTPLTRPSVSSVLSNPSAAVLIVAEQGDGDYASISEALQYAQPHTRILVRPGTYVETVVLTKDVEIVGDGPKEQIFLETHASSFILDRQGGCLTMKTERALVQGVTLRCSGYNTNTIVISQGQLCLVNCDIFSREGTAISIHTKAANPTIRDCVIFSGKYYAVEVSDYGRGLLENCEITAAAWGVSIREGGNPLLHRCKIRGQYHAVKVERYGRGTIEECDLTGGNSLGAFDIEEGCQVTLHNNKSVSNA